MSTHNMFFFKKEKNINFWASKSWLDKWQLLVHGQVININKATTPGLISDEYLRRSICYQI